ncbi:MAG: thioredoxin [Candidatus Rehaiarchaeum fermentans]|nr:thioredoxin [Candidatus Rehaiarchaeum fermentans]MCW1297236.1 thioredoxin [Candidatus Rehaiarchaeum fermentans]MCW1302258.1 thioredoxin [Candidatus Rehaiarchaeum fermentans]
MAKDLNKESFDQAISKSKVSIVDFWAEWCMPCRMLEPVMEELEKELKGKIDFYRVNVDENPELAARFGIESIPTLFIFKEGKPVDEIIGFRQKRELESLISQYI